MFGRNRVLAEQLFEIRESEVRYRCVPRVRWRRLDERLEALLSQVDPPGEPPEDQERAQHGGEQAFIACCGAVGKHGQVVVVVQRDLSQLHRLQRFMPGTPGEVEQRPAVVVGVTCAELAQIRIRDPLQRVIPDRRAQAVPTLPLRVDREHE